MDLSDDQLVRLDLPAAPEEPTLRKLLARLDADALDRILADWLWTRASLRKAAGDRH